MGRKHFITHPDLCLLEDAASDKVFSGLVAGDLNAPASKDGADARQPGETAGRLSRIHRQDGQTSICWESFAVLQSLFSPPDFAAMVSLCLLNIDLHLMHVARYRACRDFGAIAQEAEDICRIAGNLGALDTQAAAQRLQQACLTGDYRATYDLISALSQACEAAEKELNAWLVSNPAQRAS